MKSENEAYLKGINVSTKRRFLFEFKYYGYYINNIYYPFYI